MYFDIVCVGFNEVDFVSYEVLFFGYGIDGVNCMFSFCDIIISFNVSNCVGYSNRGFNVIICCYFG